MKKEHRGQKSSFEQKNFGYSETLIQLPKGICYLCLPKNDLKIYVGQNVGEAAGQTVMYPHIHMIPRRSGDMTDPRGGVRHVIPEKGNYRVQKQNTDA